MEDFRRWYEAMAVPYEATSHNPFGAAREMRTLDLATHRTGATPRVDGTGTGAMRLVARSGLHISSMPGVSGQSIRVR